MRVPVRLPEPGVKSAKKGPDLSGNQLLGALFSPNQSRELKRVLAQQFADLDDAMDAMEGPNGSVLVTERNKDVLTLRLRDYPDKGTYVRHIAQVGLVNPGPE